MGKLKNSLNCHTSGCTQDRMVIFGTKVWFWGQPVFTASFKLPRMTAVAMATKFDTKIGYNSACIRDISEIFASNRIFGDRAFEWCQTNTTDPQDMRQLMDAPCVAPSRVPQNIFAVLVVWHHIVLTMSFKLVSCFTLWILTVFNSKSLSYLCAVTHTLTVLFTELWFLVFNVIEVATVCVLLVAIMSIPG